MPRQQLRLQIWHEPERGDFIEKRMLAFGSLAFLPGGQHKLTGVVRQRDGAAQSSMARRSLSRASRAPSLSSSIDE